MIEPDLGLGTTRFHLDGIARPLAGPRHRNPRKKVTLPHPRVLLCALASLVLVRPAMAESDHRRVQFAKPYTLVLQAATGSIDVMNPFASQALATLYKDGDSFAFEPGKDYWEAPDLTTANQARREIQSGMAEPCFVTRKF